MSFKVPNEVQHETEGSSAKDILVDGEFMAVSLEGSKPQSPAELCGSRLAEPVPSHNLTPSPRSKRRRDGTCKPVRIDGDSRQASPKTKSTPTTSQRSSSENLGTDQGIHPTRLQMIAKPENFDSISSTISDANLILLNNLSFDTTKQDVIHFFTDFEIVSISMLEVAQVSFCMGYAYVYLKHECDVNEAIRQLGGQELLGRQVILCSRGTNHEHFVSQNHFLKQHDVCSGRSSTPSLLPGPSPRNNSCLSTISTSTTSSSGTSSTTSSNEALSFLDYLAEEVYKSILGNLCPDNMRGSYCRTPDICISNRAFFACPEYAVGKKCKELKCENFSHFGYKHTIKGCEAHHKTDCKRRHPDGRPCRVEVVYFHVRASCATLRGGTYCQKLPCEWGHDYADIRKSVMKTITNK